MFTPNFSFNHFPIKVVFFFLIQFTIFLSGHLFDSPPFPEDHTCPEEEEFWPGAHYLDPEPGTYSRRPLTSTPLPDWQTLRTNTHCCGSNYSHWWGMINLSEKQKRENNNSLFPLSQVHVYCYVLQSTETYCNLMNTPWYCHQISIFVIFIQITFQGYHSFCGKVDYFFSLKKAFGIKLSIHVFINFFFIYTD